MFRRKKSIAYLIPRVIDLHRRKMTNLQSSITLSDHYDVVVVGAGMVGSAFVCALQKSPYLHNMKVLVVEASPPKNTSANDFKSSFSNRVSTISSGSEQFLDEIDAWKMISENGVKKFNKMHVWDSCSPGVISFDDNDGNSLATVVENPLIVHCLHTIMSENKNHCDFAFGSTISKVTTPNAIHGSLVDVVLDDGRHVRANLLVGADGYNSRVRNLANIKHYSKKYDQSGVVATVTLEQTEDNNMTAWQQFHPAGPIALLPLSSSESSLVWSTSKSHAKTLRKVSDAAFVDALNLALQTPSESLSGSSSSNMLSSAVQQISSILQPGLYAGSKLCKPPLIKSVEPKSRSVFPYGLGHAINYSRNRIVLIGDAAHRVHPLAGQGVNLGFGDAACLIDQLQCAVKIGDDIGYIQHLSKYETLRQRHVIPMLAGIDALNGLFSTSFTPAIIARSFGLLAVNSLNPVKNAAMAFAQQ